MNAYDVVDSIIANDADALVASLNATLAAKINDAIAVKRVEVASTLLPAGTQDETEES
jgi:hypothetical protein